MMAWRPCRAGAMKYLARTPWPCARGTSPSRWKTAKLSSLNWSEANEEDLNGFRAAGAGGDDHAGADPAAGGLDHPHLDRKPQPGRRRGLGQDRRQRLVRYRQVSGREELRHQFGQ